MSTRRSHRRFEAALVGILLCVAASLTSTHAVVTETTGVGALGTAVNPPASSATGKSYEIRGGTRPDSGSNLFHSFGAFNVEAGTIADFINDSGATTSNILSRVTGPGASAIDGTIQTTGFPGANLFLINPAGIVFGPASQLNVEGSFHATTADYMKLGADGTFYADFARASLLTVSPPSAFGFLTAKPAPIDVHRGGVNLSTGAPNLFAVPAGRTLSLVGGTLNVGRAEVRNEAGAIIEDAKPANIMVPGGRLNLASVASAGQAPFDGAVSIDGFSQLGDINIRGGRILGGALFLSSVVSAQEVFIRGGQLSIHNGIIAPGAFALFGREGLPNGGEVNVQISGAVNISGTDLEPNSQQPSGIITFAGSPQAPEFFDPAKVPDITIEANSVSVSGVASIQSLRDGPGEPSHVTVNADTVTVENGASVLMLNRFQGPGGALTMNVRELNLSGDGTPSATGITGIAAQNQIHPFFGSELPSGEQDFDPRLTFADAASTTINATESVRVSGGARIISNSLGFGRGGDITINTGDLTVTGVGPESARIASQSIFSGDAGDLFINASGTVEIRNGGQIAGSTVGSGNGGSLDLTADEGIALTGADSRIVYATLPLPRAELNRLFEFSFGSSFDEFLLRFGLPEDASLFDLFAVTNSLGITAISDLTPGHAGAVLIDTPLLTLNADTRIEMSTGWEGNAGAFTANAGSLFVRNGARISSRSGIQRLSGEIVVGTGNAGKVNVVATDSLSISGNSPSSGEGSSISTTTLGDGKGGDIFLSAAGRVEILNGGEVTADSLGGTGDTGSIEVNAGTDIFINNGTISTRALTASGGNIKLTAPNIVQLNKSEITTSVAGGTGTGGNVSIDPQFVILNNSNITANAFGGPGGNINIVANNFIPSADSRISASSALSTPGTIAIESPENDIAGAIAQLPQEIVDVSALLPERCAARRAGAESSFTVAGRGGVPMDPDGYLPSFSAGNASTPQGLVSPTTTASRETLRDIKPMFLAMAESGCAR